MTPRTELFADTNPNTPDTLEHSARGYVMSGREMASASAMVQEFLKGDKAEALFTPDERLYADIALGLVKERSDELRSTGERGVMGPAFDDAYHHLRGLMDEEKAGDHPNREEIARLSSAHAAGDTAGAKLDALLAAAWQGRGLDTAVAYIESSKFAKEHPVEAPGVLSKLSDEELCALAASAIKDLFGK